MQPTSSKATITGITGAARRLGISESGVRRLDAELKPERIESGERTFRTYRVADVERLAGARDAARAGGRRR